MNTGIAITVLFVLFVTIGMLITIIDKLQRESKALALALASAESAIVDLESEIEITINESDYALALLSDRIAYLQDRIHGVDPYPIANIESTQLSFSLGDDKPIKIAPIAIESISGLKLDTNAESALALPSAESALANHTAIVAKLSESIGAVLSDEARVKALSLLARWQSKDGVKFESLESEYIKRLNSALKL